MLSNKLSFIENTIIKYTYIYCFNYKLRIQLQFYNIDNMIKYIFMKILKILTFNYCIDI